MKQRIGEKERRKIPKRKLKLEVESNMTTPRLREKKPDKQKYTKHNLENQRLSNTHPQKMGMLSGAPTELAYTTPHVASKG